MSSKIRNFNAAFGLKVEIGIGPGLIIAVASATGVYCEALPPPPAEMTVTPGRFMKTLDEVALDPTFKLEDVEEEGIEELSGAGRSPMSSRNADRVNN